MSLSLQTYDLGKETSLLSLKREEFIVEDPYQIEAVVDLEFIIFHVS